MRGSRNDEKEERREEVAKVCVKDLMAECASLSGRRNAFPSENPNAETFHRQPHQHISSSVFSARRSGGHSSQGVIRGTRKH
jgi:hypothetical protein